MVTPQHSRLRYWAARRRGRSRRPAGAEVIIANTFAANRAALEPAGLGSRVAEANRSGVAAALRVARPRPLARWR
jgi:methionine synthase I (cobalamin-dependent)